MGQLGESGEYRMRRLGVESFHVQSSESGCPPKSIKDRSLGPSEQVRFCTGAYTIYGVLQT
jgi:hypothetical protein